MRRAMAIIGAAVLTGCTSFPALEDVVAPGLRDAPYPTLTPIEPIIESTNDVTQVAEREGSAIAGRERRLRAKADALRQTDIVEPETEERMKAGVDAPEG